MKRKQSRQQHKRRVPSSILLLFVTTTFNNQVNGQFLGCLPSQDVTCNSTNDGICDSNLATTLYGETLAVIKPGCESSDCNDCDLCQKQYNYDCSGCLGADGCVWCPFDGTCRNSAEYPPSTDGVAIESCTSPSDFIFSQEGGIATCTAEGNFFNDPLYSAQEWVFDMINVEDVWQQGIFGSNIVIRINDRGIDHINPEFQGRFDREGSCDDNFRPMQITTLSEDDDDMAVIQNHGTGVASIIGATFNNNICSVGIAPRSTLSSCNIFTLWEESSEDDDGGGGGDDAEQPSYDYLVENLDSMDISQNSYGLLPCSQQDDDYDDELIITRTRKERLELLENSKNNAGTTRGNNNDVVAVEEEDSTNIFHHHYDKNQQHNRRVRRRKLQDCPFTLVPSSPNPENHPCNVCDFAATTPITRECESSIIDHCQAQYESDGTGCLSFLDYLVISGSSGEATCGGDYNNLPVSAIESFTQGIASGRDGKGVIYVFPSGNDYGSDVNFGGITNSRFTISVGSVDTNSRKASYSTPSSALLVSAPGGDSGFVSNHVGAQFSGNGQSSCGSIGYGSDFATPVVSGVIALMLDANPMLTWRDVQAILALTSSEVLDDPDDSTSTTNAAGYNHSNYYGFGIANAAQAVAVATDWQNLPAEQIRVVVSAENLNLAIPPTVDDTIPTTTSLTLNISTDQEFVVESVAVQLFMAETLHKIEISLISPLGTTSILHPSDTSYVLQIMDSLKLSTLKNYGENPAGDWTLQIRRIPQPAGDTSQCVDYSYYTLFTPSENLPAREITCQYLESEEFCINNTINEDTTKFGDTSYQPLLGITSGGNGSLGTLQNACCACGGGIFSTPDSTPITLNQWRLVAYGHDGSETIKPSEVPSEQPSEQPSEVPSQQPTGVDGGSQPTKQPTKAPTQPRAPTPNVEEDSTRSSEETTELIITIVASVAVAILIGACCYHALREPPEKDFTGRPGKSPRSNASTEII